MTQESSKEQKDSFIAHCEDSNWSDDKLTDEHEYVKCISWMHMWIVQEELSHHTVLQMSEIWSHDQILQKESTLCQVHK